MGLMIGRRAAAIEEDTSALEGQLADFFGLHYDRLVRLAALVCHANVSVEDAVQAAMEQAYHYWFHIGEVFAIRQLLGHARVPEYVGEIEARAPYRPE